MSEQVGIGLGCGKFPYELNTREKKLANRNNSVKLSLGLHNALGIFVSVFISIITLFLLKNDSNAFL